MVVYPQEVIPMFDVVVNEIFQEVVSGDDASTDQNPDPGYSIQVRTYNLLHAKAMRDLNPSDIDQMICVRGMITRATPIIPELSQARAPPGAGCAPRLPRGRGGLRAPASLSLSPLRACAGAGRRRPSQRPSRPAAPPEALS